MSYVSQLQVLGERPKLISIVKNLVLVGFSNIEIVSLMLLRS